MSSLFPYSKATQKYLRQTGKEYDDRYDGIWDMIVLPAVVLGWVWILTHQNPPTKTTKSIQTGSDAWKLS